METRIGIAKEPIFNTRNLLLVAVLVSAVTGGNLWLYRLRLPTFPAPFYLNFWQTVAWWGVGLVLLWLLSSRFEKLKRRYPRFLRYI